jgi:hypothetical protein
MTPPSSHRICNDKVFISWFRLLVQFLGQMNVVKQRGYTEVNGVSPCSAIIQPSFKRLSATIFAGMALTDHFGGAGRLLVRHRSSRNNCKKVRIVAQMFSQESRSRLALD